MTISVISTVAAGDESAALEAITGAPFTDTLNNPTFTAAIVGEAQSSPVAILHLDVCYRFINVLIAQGATINSATLRLTAFSVGQFGGLAATTIFAEAADNSAQLINGNFPNYNGRPLTVGTPWTLAPIAAWTDGSAQVSPDISPTIQAVIDRPGWVSGNAIHLFVQANGTPLDSNRRCRAFNVFGLGTNVLTIDSAAITVVTSGSQAAGTDTGATVLVDLGNDFVAAGVAVGDTLQNLPDGSSGLVDAITENTLVATLAGGTNNFWTPGDAYQVIL